MVVALLNLIWVPFVAIVGIAIPDKVLTVPILAAFVVAIAHFIALYRLRVRVPTAFSSRAGTAGIPSCPSLQWPSAPPVRLIVRAAALFEDFSCPLDQSGRCFQNLRG